MEVVENVLHTNRAMDAVDDVLAVLGTLLNNRLQFSHDGIEAPRQFVVHDERCYTVTRSGAA